MPHTQKQIIRQIQFSKSEFMCAIVHKNKQLVKSLHLLVYFKLLCLLQSDMSLWRNTIHLKHTASVWISLSSCGLTNTEFNTFSRRMKSKISSCSNSETIADQMQEKKCKSTVCSGTLSAWLSLSICMHPNVGHSVTDFQFGPGGQQLSVWRENLRWVEIRIHHSCLFHIANLFQF